jgi:dihydroorotase
MHLDMPPPTIIDVLPLLRPGDIWTHCFRGPPNSFACDDGVAEDLILRARQRGVLFDVGHGFGSFSFDVARVLVDRGILPDTISSDVHAFSVDGPAFDVLHTASKFLALGMSLGQVIARMTAAPAGLIGRPELGRLAPGCVGDAVVLEEQQGSFDFNDSHGRSVVAQRRLHADAIIVKGALWHDRPRE